SWDGRRQQAASVPAAGLVGRRARRRSRSRRQGRPEQERARREDHRCRARSVQEGHRLIYHAEHLILGIAALAVMLGIMTVTANRLIRRRLRLSVVLTVLYLPADLAVTLYPLAPATAQQVNSFAKLALVAAVINAVVLLLINPIRQDRVPERFPLILQDAIILGLVLFAATFISAELVTTSAVIAVVIGCALQDTLGNAFAGLAIQSEKPFHVGQWVRIGEFD